ncbi:dienelactone hydrolase family protein [Psychromonas ossibalaenae]|uniref:dienelactone hydrolase family protein n=1 Tax=Psychromonas ossibalaenae TaxID=444922 RepID=UPI00036FADFD|nr:dienelactone hydrolase family protein [Psychromonas ossibalaenae]
MKILIILTVILMVMQTANADGDFVTYQVSGKLYQGYFVTPSREAPLVLLVHDWDGLTDYEVKRANMLADLGYSVFAADLFGKGIRPTQVKDKRQHTGELYKDRVKMRELLQAALGTALLKGADGDNAVAMGYCFGGAAVLEYARSGADLKGFVTFHGRLKTPPGQDYKHTKGNLLIFHGSADSNISMLQYAQLAVELEKNNISHEMTNYSGAPHAFTVFGSARYQADADKKSWARFTQYLSETLKTAK